MKVRHFSEDYVFVVEVPDGTRVERRSHLMTEAGEFLADRLVIPWQGRSVSVFAEPPGLLPLLAQEGHYGMRLLSKPLPVDTDSERSSRN